MPLLALAFLGVLVGAASSEILHLQRPDLTKRIQASARASAKKLAQHFVSSKSSEE